MLTILDAVNATGDAQSALGPGKKGIPGRGVKVVESGGFGPVHELIWRLAGGHGEESPKDLENENAENVLNSPAHGSFD